MRKWKEEYKNIKSGKLDSRISELQEKLNKKTITKEEYKELQNSKKIKENIFKIDNVLEYMNKLNIQLYEIKVEETRRKKISDSEKVLKKLDEEYQKFEKEKASTEAKLKDSSLNDTEKAELKDKLSKIIEKMNQNQKDFSTNQLAINLAMGQQGKLVNIEQKKLDAKKMNISSKISKCNMICDRLVKGYSWDSIDMKLEQWQDRKLTANKGTTDKMRNAIQQEEKSKNENEKVEEKVEPTALVEISEFDQKHPRIAKIKSFFKKIGKNVKNYFKKEESEQQIKLEEKAKKEEMEQPTKVDEKTTREKDDFREYIKVVAEKGMEQADKDRLEAKKKEVQQKMAKSEGREPGDD